MAGKDRSWRSPEDADPAPAPRRRASWRELTQTVFGGGGGGQKWRSEARPAASGRHARKSRKSLYKKLAVTIAAVGVLAFGLVLELSVWGTTPVIAYCAIDYPAPIPPNAWAWEDRLAWDDTGYGRFLRSVKADFTLPDVEGASPKTLHKAWLSQLSELIASEGRNTGADGLVVYLSLHGVVDDRDPEKPRACFLLPKANGSLADWRDEANWLPFADVLTTIEQAAAPLEKHVLLALDANRVDTLWELGITRNDFAVVAREEVAAEMSERPHVSVLNSTGAEQLAWTSPELGRSVFGYFFEQGLRGGADADGDERIRLAELHDYVQSHVDRFVRAQLGEEVRQLPELWPGREGVNPAIALCESGYEPPKREAQSIPREELALVLRDYHEAFANASEQAARRGRPAQWEQRRSDLWRLEQLLSAGRAYAKDAANGGVARVETADRLLARLKKPLPDVSAMSGAGVDLSLAHQSRAGRSTYEALGDAQRQSYARQVVELANPAAAAPPTEATAAAPGTGDTATENGAAAAESKPVEPAAPAAPDRKLIEEPDRTIRAAVAWQWFCGGRRTREQVRRVLTTLLPPEPGAADEALIETHWMRLLERDVDSLIWEQHAALVMVLGQVREASERATAMLAPPDPNRRSVEILGLRSFAVLAERFSDVEARRRAWEDAALIGDTGQADELAQAGQLLVKEYLALQHLASELDDARLFWEEAVAESPALISWQVRRARYGAPLVLNGDKTRRMLQALDMLAVVLQEPQQLFVDVQTANGDRLAEIELARVNVRKSREAAETELYARLKQAYESALDEVAGNVEQGLNAIDLRRAEILLAGPAPGFGNRARLWSQRDRLANSLLNATADAKPAGTVSPVDVEPLRALAGWALQSDGAAAATAAQWRRQLEELAPLAPSLANAWKSEDPALALRDIDIRARRLAAWSPWSIQLPENMPEPVVQRSWWQQASYVDWQVRRVLEDFLADAESTVARDDGKSDSRSSTRHYFSRASEQMLAAAPGFREGGPTGDFAVVPEAAAAMERLGASLTRQLALRIESAAAGVQPQPPPLQAKLIGASSAEVQFAAAAKELPQGVAAVWIPPVDGLSVNGEPNPLGRNSRAVGKAAIQPLSFSYAWDQATGGSLVPTMLYRGHYWRGRQDIPSIGTPLAVKSERQPFYPPQVTVHDPNTQRVAFSIILDCSGSMIHEGTNRLAVAKDALRAALDPVAQSGRHRVSLWLFGHQARALVNDEKTAFNISQSRYAAGKNLPLVHPDDDIEKFHPLGSLDRRSFEVLMNGLHDPAIAPWGSTPLYTAIAEALEHDGEDLQRDPIARRERFRRHVLVITDGNDDKIVDREVKGNVAEENRVQPPPQLAQRRIDQLADLFERFPGVRLDVIGFPLERGEQYNAQLVRLAEKTQGELVKVETPDQLVAHLKRAIGMRSYQVFRPNNEAVGRPALLNDPSPVPKDESAPPQPFFARLVDEPGQVVSEPFYLLRSESLSLYLKSVAGRESLVHRRVVDDNPNARHAQAGDGVFVTIHNTTRASLTNSPLDLVMFQASLQHPDEEKYMAPPAEIWLEADLPAPGGGTRTYLAYDRALVPREPAARLQWTIDGYPLSRSVQTAELRLWWRDEPSPAKRSLPVAELREAVELADFGRPVTLAAKASDQQLVIQEQHADDPAGDHIPWLRVDVSVPSEYIANVRREFFPEIRSARHTFEFRGDKLPAIDSAEVVLRELSFDRASSAGVHYIAFPQINLPTPSSN